MDGSSRHVPHPGEQLAHTGSGALNTLRLSASLPSIISCVKSRLVAFGEGSLPSKLVANVIPRLRAANLSPVCDKLAAGRINVTHPLGSEFIETDLKKGAIAAFQIVPIRFLH